MTAFRKYHGLGNDFILIDNRGAATPSLGPGACVPLLDRHTGVGGDGVIFLLPPEQPGQNDARMRIVNADGSVPEMCGNGIRCLAHFAIDLGLAPPGRPLRVETPAGVMVTRPRAGGLVEVDMGKPVLGDGREGYREERLRAWDHEWVWTEVSMGNPHCVVFLDRESEAGGNALALRVLDQRLEEVGPLFERHERFPARTNVEFVKMDEDGRGMKVVVWERGAGRTRACGTGACACAVAAVVTGRAKRDTDIRVTLPGGDLNIKWALDGSVYMSGPAEYVFEGKLAESKVLATAGSAP